MRRSVAIVSIGILALAVLVCSTASILHGSLPSRSLRIIYTCNSDGDLKPCGCGGQKNGGFARRATMLAQLKKEIPNTILVDSGNIINTPSNKADMMFQLMEEFGYVAIGIGMQEHAWPGESLYDMAAKHGIAVIDSNPYPSPKAQPYIVRDVGGVKVGIVSFGFAPADQDPDSYSFRRTVYTNYRQAREQSDVLIVLDQANRITPEWLKRNAQRLGAPDLVIGGAAQEMQIDGTYLEPPMFKARQVGVVDVEIASDGAKKVATKRIELTESVAPDDTIAKRIEAFEMTGHVVLQMTNKNAPITASESAALKVSEKTYYASSQCRACHVKEYADWAASKHASALKTLKDAGRMLDECLPCHSDEYMRRQQVTIASDGVGGVECATCHYESLPHGVERSKVVARPRVSAAKCLACHNKDRSPNYDEQAYFPRIMHKGVSAPNPLAITR